MDLSKRGKKIGLLFFRVSPKIKAMIKERFTIGASEDECLIRKEVFIEEQGFKNEFDALDQRLWHIVLYLDDIPVATGRIEPLDPETYRIERVAVRKAFRGQSLGTYVMKFLMLKIKEIGGHKAVVHAQYDKTDFYRKLGFKKIAGSETLYDEGYPHIAMEKELNTRRRVK